MKRLYRLTPYFHLSGNPFFDFEARRVRRADSAKTLIDFSIRRVVIICIVMLVFWMITIALGQNANLYYAVGMDVIYLLLASTLLAGLLLDVSSMANSFGAITSEITSGRWVLLRLTELPSNQLVAAKYGTAQLRAWRTMMMVIGLRVAVILVLLLAVVSTLLDSRRINAFTEITALSFIVSLVVGAGFALLYVVEPFWRMRTVTALGISVSARGRVHVSSILIAVGTVAAFWLVQGFVAFALMLGVGFFIFPLLTIEAVAGQAVVCSPILTLIAISITVYGFYSVAQTWALRRAERFAARLD